MRNTRVTIAAVAAAAALTLAACSSDSSDTDTDAGGDADTTSEESEDTGGEGGGDTIRIGIKFDQPGLGYQEGSEYTGFDVDVATYVAESLGYTPDQIEWVSAPSAQRENLLQTGQVDMIFATYSITDDRDEVVDFAGPYYVAGQDLLVRADDDSITGPEDLNGKNLCSVTGSTSAERIKEDYAEDVQLVEQAGYADCVTVLESGQVERRHHRRHHPRRPGRHTGEPGQVQGGRQPVLRGELRHRHPRGLRPVRGHQRGRHRDDRLR